VPDLEPLSLGELVELARAQAIRIDEQAVVLARQDAQITVLSTQLADLIDRFEQKAGELAELRHLWSRNSANSWMPHSRDDDPGSAPPPLKPRRAKPSGRAKGKRPGAGGSALRWGEADELDARRDCFPEGACSCGADLVGAATPAEGKKEAKGYLHVACTDLYTHFLLGDRSMATFRQTVLLDLEPDTVIVHDRYHNYDSAQLGELTHQLCMAHILRDLTGAVELYPDDTWPVQRADETARADPPRQPGPHPRAESLGPGVKDIAVRALRAAVTIGLAATADLDDHRPGARKARLLREAFHQREDDFLRFTTDLRIPPTSNQV
jgi:hypothetical protein